MVCNSIPGHPLGFSPLHNRNAKLWNVGWKPVFRCQRSRFHKQEFWNSQSTVNNTRVPEVLESFGFRRSREDQHLHIRRTSHVAKHPGKNAFFFFFLRCFQCWPRDAKHHRDPQEQNPSQSNASDRTTSAGSVKVCNKMPSYGPDGSCSCVSGCEFLFSQARVIKRKTGS